MSAIQMKDVNKVASLAKLEFDGVEKQKFTRQFDEILGFVEKITGIPTEDVAPTTHAISNSNVTRDDEVHKSFEVSDIESVAPRVIDGSIVVPKVLEH